MLLFYRYHLLLPSEYFVRVLSVTDVLKSVSPKSWSYRVKNQLIEYCALLSTKWKCSRIFAQPLSGAAQSASSISKEDYSTVTENEL